jgi:phage host-nuclease inhibitor protein Gam
VIGERLSPWKVELKGVEEVLGELDRMGLARFVRTIREVNKDAMLATKEDRDLAATVKGVTVVREDTFFVNPTELGEDVTRLRKITIGKEKVKR